MIVHRYNFVPKLTNLLTFLETNVFLYSEIEIHL